VVEMSIRDPSSESRLNSASCTRAPAPLPDWNQMKKRELEFLDVSFP